MILEREKKLWQSLCSFCEVYKSTRECSEFSALLATSSIKTAPSAIKKSPMKVFHFPSPWRSNPILHCICHMLNTLCAKFVEKQGVCSTAHNKNIDLTNHKKSKHHQGRCTTPDNNVIITIVLKFVQKIVKFWFAKEKVSMKRCSLFTSSLDWWAEQMMSFTSCNFVGCQSQQAHSIAHLLGQLTQQGGILPTKQTIGVHNCPGKVPSHHDHEFTFEHFRLENVSNQSTGSHIPTEEESRHLLSSGTVPLFTLVRTQPMVPSVPPLSFSVCPVVLTPPNQNFSTR